MPHGLSFSADAADLHGNRARRSVSDYRHPAPDAGYPEQLPMGAVSAQPRRTDARNGHRRRARLSVVDLRQRSRRKIELMNSLLLSFPGSPIIYYGDEIGMGDNIYLGDRNGVRTPMQWTPDRNGGFSRADPARLYAPTVMDPVYGYEAVNVEAQSRSLSSLLSATKRLISVRKSTLAFGRGTMSFT